MRYREPLAPSDEGAVGRKADWGRKNRAGSLRDAHGASSLSLRLCFANATSLVRGRLSGVDPPRTFPLGGKVARPKAVTDEVP